MANDNITTADEQRDHIAACVCNLAAAFIEHQGVQIGEISDLFATLKKEVEGLFADAPVEAAEPEKLVPIVPIKKTVTPDHIISLEDGKPYKTLKRHLTGRGMTPAEYRQKWGLPHDYPMVAANYAAQRSELAKGIGLGRTRNRTAA